MKKPPTLAQCPTCQQSFVQKVKSPRTYCSQYCGQHKFTLRDKYLQRVIEVGPTECWRWRGATSDAGYGQISNYHGRRVMAHRVAWELYKGPIPKGLWVLHRCDNPPCTNPCHLWLGTNQDNIRDMDEKGRRPHGDNHWTRRPDKGAK